MLQTDSIQNITEAGEGVMVQKHYPPTPAQILSWLPKDATPAQQDSAIQRHIKPCEIHWSERPDTLHLPGHTIGKSALDASLPQYYKESYFSDKDYFHPEIMGGRQGVAGDPLPYSVANDNFMTSLLLILVLLTILAFSRSQAFVVRQIKGFLYTPHGKTTEVTETTDEIRSQIFLALQTCLLFSLLYFSYLRDRVDTFTIDQPNIIGLFTGVFVTYNLISFGIYTIVNWIFFDGKNNIQWHKTKLFLLSCEGLFLMPLVLLRLYFDLSYHYSVIYLILVLFAYKMSVLYKCFATFFAPKGLYMHIFLYFCTLELLPMVSLWGLLTVISEYLKINF